MPTQQRVAVMASTFAAGTMFASTAMLGGVPMTPLHSDGLFSSVHRDIVLTASGDELDTTTFAGSLQWLMDDALGVGQKTLPDLIGNDVTVDSLLGGSGLSVTSEMSEVFNTLGLDNIEMGDLLAAAGLPADSTMDELLDKVGLGDGTTLSGLMEGMLGIGAGTSLAELVDQVGFGDKTVDELMGMVGFPGSTTVDGLMTDMGLENLIGLLSGVGVTSTTDLSDLMGLMGTGAGDLTLDDLLHAAPTDGTAVEGDGFLSSIGEMTLGTMMGFDDQTTLTSIIDGLMFPDADGGETALGDQTLGELLGSVNMSPDETLADLLGGLTMGQDSDGDDVTLGGSTLGDILGTMAGGSTVDDTTSLSELMGDMGMGDLTLDQWIGLG